MNPFLRYLADKNSAHTQTDRQTDTHTPMTTRPCGLRRAGKKHSERRKHCMLAVLRWSQTTLPRCRPPSRGHGTAKI